MTPLSLNAYLQKNVRIQLENSTQLTGVLVENSDGSYSVSGNTSRFAAADVSSATEV